LSQQGLSGTDSEHQQYPQQRAAEATSTAPDLLQVIDAWPDLPEAVKAGILTMVGVVRQTDERNEHD